MATHQPRQLHRPPRFQDGCHTRAPRDDEYGQRILSNSMRDTTTREAPDLLHSVRGTSDSGLMTRARAAVGWAA